MITEFVDISSYAPYKRNIRIKNGVLHNNECRDNEYQPEQSWSNAMYPTRGICRWTVHTIQVFDKLRVWPTGWVFVGKQCTTHCAQ